MLQINSIAFLEPGWLVEKISGFKKYRRGIGSAKKKAPGAGAFLIRNKAFFISMLCREDGTENYTSR